MQISTMLDYIAWAMIQSAALTNQITSVDRLMKYSSLPAEPQPERKLTKLAIINFLKLTM